MREYNLFTLAESPPYGLVIESDLASDLPYGVAVHQPEIKHLPVGFIMDMLHNNFFDLLVAVFRA